MSKQKITKLPWENAKRFTKESTLENVAIAAYVSAMISPEDHFIEKSNNNKTYLFKVSFIITHKYCNKHLAALIYPLYEIILTSVEYK